MFEYREWKRIYEQKRRALTISFHCLLFNLEENLVEENHPIFYLESQIQKNLKPKVQAVNSIGSLYPLEIKEVTLEMKLDYSCYLMANKEQEATGEILSLIYLYERNNIYFSLEQRINRLIDILEKTSHLLTTWEEDLDPLIEC